MKKWMRHVAAMLLLAVLCGCGTFSDNRLPSEDIEAPELNRSLIEVLKNPALPPNSKEKYEAAMKLIERVDFSYTRETRTVDTYFYHRDAVLDDANSVKPVFTFRYSYGNKSLRISFFTYKMFVVRVEIQKL